MLIDLHTHSCYSDGQLTPSELVLLAKKRGVELLALTDHDTTDGISEAQNMASHHNIQFVPGIEFSASWQGMTFHVVGLYVDTSNLKLQSAISENKRSRTSRNHKMLVQLEKIGANLSQLIQLNQSSLITRAHIAKALLEQGYGKNNNDIFKHYLRRGRPGYCKPSWLSLQQVSETIVAAGGIAVLAHPLRYGLTATKLKRLLTEHQQYGLSAIEILSGPTSKIHFNFIREIAEQFQLKVSVGSDFHNLQQSFNLPGKHWHDSSLPAVWH